MDTEGETLEYLKSLKVCSVYRMSSFRTSMYRS